MALAALISFCKADFYAPATDLLHTHRLLLVTSVEIIVWVLGLSLQLAAACSDLERSCRQVP